MEIKNIDPKKLIPYENNPRQNDQAVEAVKASIEEFGFKVPIVIDKNNVIVCGHTRQKAAIQLHLSTVPCVVADDLTDEQIRAFRLADNKTAELAEWDFDLLNEEIQNIFEIDMEEFGFELYDPFREHEEQAEKTQERVENILNLGLGVFPGEGYYDIPVIAPVTELPPIRQWIGFNYVLSDDDPEGKAVHFFIDDYQFERIWIVNAKKMYESTQAKPTSMTVGNQPNKSYSQDMNHRLNNGIALDSDSKFMKNYLTKGLHPIGKDCTLKRGAHDTVVNQLLKRAGVNMTYDQMSVGQLNAALKGTEFGMKAFGSFGANDSANPFIGGSQAGGREIIIVARTASTTKVIAGARKQQEFITGVDQKMRITGFKATNQTAYPQMGGAKPVVEMYVDMW